MMMFSRPDDNTIIICKFDCGYVFLHVSWMDCEWVDGYRWRWFEFIVTSCGDNWKQVAETQLYQPNDEQILFLLHHPQYILPVIVLSLTTSFNLSFLLAKRDGKTVWTIVKYRQGETKHLIVSPQDYFVCVPRYCHCYFSIQLSSPALPVGLLTCPCVPVWKWKILNITG